MKNKTVLSLILIALITMLVSCSEDLFGPVDPLPGMDGKDMVTFDQTSQAAVGTHGITVVYYEAYIYDDHDAWPAGAGEWYFGLFGGGAWASGSFGREYSRDGPGRVNFSDYTRSWNVSSSPIEFAVEAREKDIGWDYESSLPVIFSFPGPSVNTWHNVNTRKGDVRHYYRYYIENDDPLVGSISGPSSGIAGVPYTWSTTGSDPDGDSFGYQWSGHVSGTGPSITHTFADPGRYTISVRTIDQFNDTSAWRSMTVTIDPNVGGVLRKWKVSPSWHSGHVGDTLTLRAYVVNQGTVDLDAVVAFTIADAQGTVVAEPMSSTVVLAPGEAINGKLDSRMTATWTPTVAGGYVVNGYLKSNPESHKTVKLGIK